MGSPTITMFAPDGSPGEIPADKVRAAQQAGFKRAYSMTSPDGKAGVIPEDRVADAEKAGFKKGPAPYDASSDHYRDRYDVSAGGIAKGALDEAGNILKGGASMFAAPQGVGEALLGPALPAYRMIKGYGQSAVAGLKQAASYAQNGQPMRAAATVVGAVNPLSSGPTASINAKVDQGAPISDVIGQGMTDAGLLAAPEVARVAAPVVSGMADSVAKGLYGNVLKPSTTLTAAQRSAVLNAGLRNKIPVSAAGAEMLADKIQALDQAKWGEINKNPTAPIDPNAAAADAQAFVTKRFANQVNPEADMKAIGASIDEFLRKQGARPGSPAVAPQPTGLLDANGRPIMTQGTPATPASPARPMAAADAQSIKQNTQSINSKKYGQLGSAETETQKAITYALNQAILKQFPELAGVNAEQSSLIRLQPMVQRAVGRVANNHTVGIEGPMLGTAATVVTGSPQIGTAVAAAKSVLNLAPVKTQLAIALSRAAKIPYPKALARVSAYSAALQSSDADSQGYSSGDSSSQ